MYHQALAHFQQVDPPLAEVMKQMPEFQIQSKSDPFRSLCDDIISQQLSGKVASVIFNRFLELFPDGLTPEAILKLSHEDIRKIGTSNAKAKYVLCLAEEVASGRLVLEKLSEMSSEEAIETLTKVKGIGPWTAEMFLMFSLGRPDVFSIGDLGLRRGIQKIYGLTEEPTKAELLEISAKWSPYRTYAAKVLWKSLEL